MRLVEEILGFEDADSVDDEVVLYASLIIYSFILSCSHGIAYHPACVFVTSSFAKNDI